MDGAIMKCSRLNLSVLRKQRSTASVQVPRSPEEIATTDNSVRVSRRSMLGLAGLAATLLPSAVKAVGTSLLGGFSVVQEDGLVAFALRGKTRWTIDCRRYGGSPKLYVEQTKEKISITLTDALYPGTNIPADL